MQSDNRVLSIWIDVTWGVLPPLVILAYMLGWSPVVRLVLTIVFCVAILGTRIVLRRRSASRSRRAARRRGRAQP